MAQATRTRTRAKRPIEGWRYARRVMLWHYVRSGRGLCGASDPFEIIEPTKERPNPRELAEPTCDACMRRRIAEMHVTPGRKR